MPPLNEGDLLFMPIADPSISLQENTRIAQRQNAALDADSRRSQASSRKSARADTSTDPVAAEHDRNHRPAAAARRVAARA